MAFSAASQIRKGSTTPLLLTMLVDGPMYGHEILKDLKERSGGAFNMSGGLAYPSLKNMADKGLVESVAAKGPSGHMCRRYTITALGLECLYKLRGEWVDFTVQLHTTLGTGESVGALLAAEYTKREVERVIAEGPVHHVEPA